MSIVPTYSKTAINTPTPQAPSTRLFVANCGNPGTAPKSSSLAQGDVGQVITKINQNALRSDLISTYGGGGFGVLWGLTLSEGAGLTLNVAAGQASIVSLTELATSYTMALPASSPACYIWLKDNGALTYQNNTLTPPDASCVYLGCVTTSSGAVTAIDYSGVVSLRGNSLYRKTGDTQAPTDTPPSTITLTTSTSGWVYDWDGSQHKQRVPPEHAVFNTNGLSLNYGHLSLNYRTYTGSGTVALTSSSANIQRFLPTASMTVTLPPSGTITPGMQYQIFNDADSGSGKNVVVKDSTGSITISTLNPQQKVVVGGVYSSGTLTWPTSLTSSATAP